MREMISSLLVLNPRSRAVRNDLRDCHRMHQTLLRAFGATRAQAQMLYRVSGKTVLVQSALVPRWEALPADYLAEPPHVGVVQLRYDVGDSLRFLLRADPVVCRNRKRRGLQSEEELIHWIRRKLGAAGCSITSVSCRREGVQRGVRQGATITIAAVLFEGELTVSDPLALADTIRDGVGPAKAYGCGLLTVWRRPG